MAPRVTSPPGPSRPSTERAVTDLPEPDSPTSPTRSPAATRKPTPWSTVPAPSRAAKAVCRSSTSSSGAPASVSGSAVGGGCAAGGHPWVQGIAQAVAQHVERHHDDEDGRARHQREVRSGGHQVATLPEHAAQIRPRRLCPETEEAQPRGLEDHPSEAGASGPHDHRRHVRHEFHEHDARVRVAGQPRRVDEVLAHQAEGGTAHGAREEGHVDERDGDGGVAQPRPQHRDDGQREQQ